MPASAVFSTLVSMSLAITRTGGVSVLNVSQAVIAIEYGSSPVEAAEHQIVSGAPPVRIAALLRRCSERIGKWWSSRKNAVRLVVSALVNASHSPEDGA